MTLDQIYTQLIKWVQEETGKTAVKADQAAPRPKSPYVVIKPMGERKLGGDEETRLSASVAGMQKIVGQRQRTVTIDVIGKGANNIAADLRLSLGKFSVQNSFNIADIAVVSTTAINNLTEIFETAFNERAAFDIMLAYTSDVDENVGYIEKVEINESIIELPTE